MDESWKLKTEVNDPYGDSHTEIREYEIDPNSPSYGQRKEMVNRNGSWMRYEFDSEGRISAVIRQHQDQPRGWRAGQEWDSFPLRGEGGRNR